MKVGTVPKITAGAVAIIVLAFIGTRQFLSSRKDSSPSVEVVTSTPNETAQTDAMRKGVVTAPVREDKPQISAEEMQQIEDFFAQLDEADAQSRADTAHLPTDAASNQDSDAGNVTESPVASEDAVQSAKDVMNAYVEAFRNLDFDAILPLLTDAAKEEFQSRLPILMGELPEGVVDIVVDKYNDMGLPEEVVDESLQMIREMMQPMLKQMFSQIEIVSSKHVGDEFHFRLKVPLPEMPEVLGMLGLDMSEMPEMIEVHDEMPEMPDLLRKMRKEDGTWQIYEQ